jgi:RNA polymerase sigma-70 factor (ECF subfamily)
MALSDRELIALVAAHDEAAFEQLCAVYREPLLRHLVRMVRAPEVAEDLLQDTLLRIWTHADQWDGRGVLRAWLFRVATNVALNALRTARRRPQAQRQFPNEAEDDMHAHWLADSAIGPDEAVERAEERSRLRALVARLPEEKREVLRMVHGDEMAIGDVARTLGIPPGTVRSRLHYATRRLARELGEQDDG